MATITIKDSPDLSYRHFHVFALMKSHPAGIHFTDDHDVKHAVSTRLRVQVKDFYAAGIEAVTSP